MRTHSNDFLNAIKLYGRQISAKIIYNSTTIEKDNILRVNPSFQTNLFKTVMKQIEVDCNSKISAKNWINNQFGVKVSGAYEYLDFGNYYINEEPEYNIDTKSYIHLAYDKMIESMIKHDSNPLSVIYPISHKNLVIAICTKLGWSYDLTTYINDDTEITSDLYSGLGWTYRDILDDLCPATMGNFIFNKDDKFTVKYPTETSKTIDDEFLRQENVTIGKKYGPVNSLVLSRSEDSDNIFRKDDTSISTNGLTELKIKDNLLLSSVDRDNFIDEMFTQINGLEYYIYDISTIGMCIFEPLDRYTINHDGTNYSVLMLNDDIQITQGLKESCYVDEPEETTTDYSTSAPSDSEIKNAVIITNKNKANIEIMTSKIEGNTTNISLIQEDVEGINQTVADVSTNLNNNYQTTEQVQALVNGNTEEINNIKANFTTLTQTSTDLQVQITSINTNGVSKLVNTLFTIDENGLNLSKTGEAMSGLFGYFTVDGETRLGLQVNRDTTEVLGVDNTGVRAENVTVRKYLVIGDNSRMENYQDGTAVFFIGE